MRHATKIAAALAAIAQTGTYTAAYSTDNVKKANPSVKRVGDLVQAVFKTLAAPRTMLFGRKPLVAGTRKSAIQMLNPKTIAQSDNALTWLKNFGQASISRPGTLTADILGHGLITVPALRRGLRQGREKGVAAGAQRALDAARQQAEALPFMRRVGLITGNSKQASTAITAAKLLTRFVGIPLGVGFGADAAGKGLGYLQGLKKKHAVTLNPDNLSAGEKLLYALGLGSGRLAELEQHPKQYTFNI